MTQTDYLIAGIRQLCERPVSEEELHQLKRCMLDWAGVSFAGATLLQEKMQPIIKNASDGPCSSFLTERKLDLHTASFLNGYASHVLELDDGHRFGMLHLEALLFSSLWAVAQQEKLDFEHFVKGILIGYQTTVQLARRIQPEHKKRGYHGTGTCGTIGVACAVAAALDFTDKQFESAIGAAVTRAAGLLSVLDSPSELKPYNVAGAIESGIMSAYIALCGFTSPADPIDGKRGFFKTYAKGDIVDSLVSFSNESEIMNIYFKPYASCRHCHAPVECALVLKEKYNVRIKDIQEVIVETYRLAIDGHNHTEITGTSSAKMSIPYCVAASLVKAECGLDVFADQVVSDSDIVSLTKKVRVDEDEVMTLHTPGRRGARVTVKTLKGQSYTVEVDNPLGEPEHPMSDADLTGKYYDMMGFARVETTHAKYIYDLIWNLETTYNELLKVL